MVYIMSTLYVPRYSLLDNRENAHPSIATVYDKTYVHRVYAKNYYERFFRLYGGVPRYHFSLIYCAHIYTV